MEQGIKKKNRKALEWQNIKGSKKEDGKKKLQP